MTSISISLANGTATDFSKADQYSCEESEADARPEDESH